MTRSLETTVCTPAREQRRDVYVITRQRVLVGECWRLGDLSPSWFQTRVIGDPDMIGRGRTPEEALDDLLMQTGVTD